MLINIEANFYDRPFIAVDQFRRSQFTVGSSFNGFAKWKLKIKGSFKLEIKSYTVIIEQNGEECKII